MENSNEYLIGRTVNLFPRDTYPKYGIIEAINKFGYFIKITETAMSGVYTEGDLVFINHATPIQFIVVPENK